MKRGFAEWHERGLTILLACACVLACAVPGAAQRPRSPAVRAAPAPSVESDAAAFDRLVDRLPAEDWRPLAAARVAPAWDALDALIARRLNTGVLLAVLNAELATLHRYQPATPGAGQRIGGVVDWKELPRGLPSWFVRGLPELGEDHVLGQYNLGLGTPGRATLFVQVAGVWQAASHVTASLPLSVSVVPDTHDPLGLVVVERFTAADRSECHVSLWRIAGGQLRRDQLLPGTYWDCAVAAGANSLLLAYAQMPKGLSAGVLGPRLAAEMSLSLRGGRWGSQTRPLNPWLHEYDRFYRLGGQGAARAIASQPSLLRRLSRHVLDDGGDLIHGSGWVLVEDARGERRVEMAATENGVWQVVRVVDVAPSSADNR